MEPEKKQLKNSFGNPIWFKAKPFGYGWYPVTWQGWLILLAFGVIITAAELLIINDEKVVAIIGGACIFIIAIISLIIIARRYGEKARWRWGKKDEDVSHDNSTTQIKK